MNGLSLTLHNGQPRVPDLSVAEMLDYAQPRDVRKLIARRLDELSRYGEVCATVAQTTAAGGRPSTAYLLNEGQALLICAVSDTVKAADARETLIRTFMDWRKKQVAGEFRTSEGPSHVHNPFEITAEAIPVLQTKLQMVREARHLHGHERARQLWAQLQLPSVAVNPHSGRSEAYDLLQYILDGKCMGQTLRGLLDAALEGDKGRADTLKRAGIVAEPGRDGFIVANQHPQLEAILEGTEWAKGKWQWVLRRLPGAHPVPPRLWMKGVNARGLFLPCGLLDFGEHSIDRDFAPAADGT